MRLITFFILFFSMVFAQKPVRIDEILTKTNHFKLDTTFSYTNMQSSDNVSTSHTFQTQNGDFVTIPAYLGASKNNRDYLNLDFTLRYGVTKDIELFTSVNGYHSDNRYTLSNEFQNKTDKGFNALSIGATYQVKEEDETPSLLLGTSIQTIENIKIDNKTYTNHFKSFRVFATSFYSVDPVVFLLSTSYGFNASKTLGEHKRDDADIFTFSPQVYFAVNPYTSLNWGVKYSYHSKTKIDDSTIGNNGSNLSFMTGLSYEFTEKTILNVNAEHLNTNALSQNTFSTTLSYTF